MASHPAKRPRTDAGPSSAGHLQEHEPSVAPDMSMTAPQSSPAESHAAPAQASQPSSAPENMAMPLHEALAYIDPDDKTPHELYLILIYAAAAHSDVAEMMQRFACVHRDRIVLEREMRELPAATGSVAQFVPLLPRPPARPKEVIEAEKAERAAQRAARREAQQQRKAARAARRKMNIPAKDKSFAYLVRQTEEELGWTGIYDDDSGPKQRWSQKKKRQVWHSRSVEVEANVTWMQERILQNMTESRERRAGKGVVVEVATFGTKKNALVAMNDIIKTILVDTGEIGAQLREKWFPKFLDKFRRAVGLLSPEELAMLRNDRTWMKGLRSLVQGVKSQGLAEEVLEEILTSFAPGTTTEADWSSDEDEGPDSASLDGAEESSEEESDGSLTGVQSFAEAHFEHCDESEAESSEEENSEIG